MKFYDTTVLKIDLDTKDVNLSNFTTGNEITQFSEVPQEYIDAHDEFTEGIIVAGATIDLDDMSYVYEDRGDGVKWYLTADSAQYGTRYFSARRFKSEITYI